MNLACVCYFLDLVIILVAGLGSYDGVVAGWGDVESVDEDLECSPW